jgi:UDP-2,3-diacylglucosamine hydrolase
LADYFLSDVHLRLDRPDRGRRLAGLVDRLDGADRLVVVGDLCDFWFASRQGGADPALCPGLRAFRDFRARGGAAILVLGNHDAWLGAYYRERLGLEVRDEPLRLESHGLRLHLAHGHRVRKGKSPWKAAMEGRAFLRAFGALPRPVASGLESLLDAVNARGKAEADRRLAAAYREVADGLAGSADLVVFGHVHRPLDDDLGRPRLVVLGDWLASSSYLRIDWSGVEHRVEPDLNAPRP